MEEKNKTAAQHQGEPVRDDSETLSYKLEYLGPISRCDVACGSYGDKFHRWDDEGPYVEYEDHLKYIEAYKGEIDYLKSIIANPEQPAPVATRPVHANPPPGTEPSGTHHDNDGLDEWSKPQDDQARRAELLESLAKQVYQSWESQPGFVPWVDGGNSTKQDEARQIASRTFELALANQVGD